MSGGGKSGGGNSIIQPQYRCFLFKMVDGKFTKIVSEEHYKGTIIETQSVIEIRPLDIDVSKIVVSTRYLYYYPKLGPSFDLGVCIRITKKSFYFFDESRNCVYIFTREALEYYINSEQERLEEQESRDKEEIKVRKEMKERQRQFILEKEREITERNERLARLRCNKHEYVDGKIITTIIPFDIKDTRFMFNDFFDQEKIFLDGEFSVENLERYNLYGWGKLAPKTSSEYSLGILYKAPKKESSFWDKCLKVIFKEYYHFLEGSYLEPCINIYSKDALEFLFLMETNLNARNQVIAPVVMLQELLVYYHLDTDSFIDLYQFLNGCEESELPVKREDSG